MNHMATQTAMLSQIKSKLTAIDNRLRRLEDVFGLPCADAENEDVEDNAEDNVEDDVDLSDDEP